MNNDDNKLTTEQEAQHNAVTKHENSTDTNTQSNTDSNSSTPHSDTKTNVKADSTTNADEAFKANTNEKTTSNNDTHCETEKTWHNKNAIKRGIAMLGYGFLAGFVRLGITLIAVFQFFSLLFSEKPNQPLVKFGQNLNTYQYQINQFLTVNSEIYPFPFADWPDSAPKESVDH